VTYWYERYFTADYWAYATAEYTAERTAAEVSYLAAVLAGEAPGRRVLDVGCGIGRHAVALAGRGFDVVGVDVSPWALDRARAAARAAGATARFHLLDALRATDAEWPVREVDAVVCVQAFGWGTDAQQLRLLQALRRLLVPGGVLVLDHSDVSAILRMYAPRSDASVGDHTFEFERRYDPLTGRSGGVLRVRRPSGETVELPDDVRLYQPPEVAALLTEAGFEVRRADADFQLGAPVGLDTRYVQFVARAPAPDRPGGSGSPGWPVSALAGHRAPIGAGELDLRWAPDEVDFVDDALRLAWESVTGSGVLDRMRRYDLTDPYAAGRSTDVLSAHFGVELAPSQVTAGAGATGLLHALAALAASSGRPSTWASQCSSYEHWDAHVPLQPGAAGGGVVLMDLVGHPELALAAAELGVPVRAEPLGEPAEALRTVHTMRPAVIVLDRPGVTGRVWPVEDVRALAEAAAGVGGVLVVDETCACYLPASESAVGQIAAGLVVVRSMSKGYCCGGLRIGFAVASPDVAERVRAVCPPLAAGALALDVALALLRQGDVLAALRARVAEIKPRFVGLLAAVGVDADPGDPRLPWVTVDAAARPRLAELGIAGKAVPAAPGGPELVRLSVPLSEPRWRDTRTALTVRHPVGR